MRYLEKRFTQIYKALYEALFLQKIGKLKIGLNVVEAPMEIMQIGAYSKRSCEKTKANLKFIFTRFFCTILKVSFKLNFMLIYAFPLVLTPVQRK